MCGGVSSKILFALLFLAAALLTPWATDVELSAHVDDDCSAQPVCSAQPTLLGGLRCYFFRYPVDVSRGDYKKHVLNRLKHLTQRNLKGQSHVVEGVVRDIAMKLENPEKPLVLHFAGDNGVGKTTLAQLISLALGFKCRDVECAVGDSTLVLSGVSYDGYSVQEFRRAVVQKIVQHAARYPRNGVVIINDLGALSPDLVRVLLPLLGRAPFFPEAPNTPLAALTVIVTTDFGRQGRTRGKSLAEMRRIVEEDFKSLYSLLSSSMIRTYPFLPTSITTAKDIVRLTVMDYRCRHRDVIREIQVDDDIVAWIVDFVRDDLPMENGRCVADAVSALVGPGVMRHLLDSHLGPVSLRLDFDENASITVGLVS